VSLVLEALKKLDREKGRDERGFVVMAAAPWPSRTARHWPAWAALGVATAGAVVAVMALRTSPAPPSRPEPPAPSVAAPAPAPAPALARSEPPTPVPRSAPARVAPKAAVETPPVAAAVVPPARTATPDPGPRLQAISERDGQPIAIINDHLVRVGDEVDGIRVIAIRVDAVDVEVRGRRTTLRF